jgi:DNA/RNA endonuclease G (NUC1)
MFDHQPIDGLMKLIAVLLLALAPASAQAPFGSPACPGEPADRVFFFLCHSPAHKVPFWVAQTLTPDQFDGAASRPSGFRQDGALFEGEAKTIGPGQVAVPSHTYKVVLFMQGDSAAMFAAIVPNQDNLNGPPDQFAVTVDEIEQRTGLDFFSELEDALENELEARREFLPVWRCRRPRDKEAPALRTPSASVAAWPHSLTQQY